MVSPDRIVYQSGQPVSAAGKTHHCLQLNAIRVTMEIHVVIRALGIF